jgi:16S rRNA (cytosine967-C5)-methyltransferase
VSASADRSDRGTSSRRLAADIVRRVMDEGAYSNLLVRRALRESKLDARDRALVAELAYGTVRRALTLDWVLARHTRRPLEKASPRSRALLRMGAYQVLFTRIPDHAAIATAVDLAAPHDRSFVNAVLRAVASDRPGWPEGDGDDAVSIRTGVAPWAVRELRSLLGQEAESAASALGDRAPLTIRANTCRTSPEALEDALWRGRYPVRRGTIEPDALIVERGDPTELAGFEDGWFAVQDQASSFVVRALDPRHGERILDACAGPGGKTGYIACRVGSDGSTVAADASPGRARLVGEEARRLRVRAMALAQDARHPALAGPFDRILVDAPCSGLGSARRRPELLWRARRQNLPRLARLQVAITAGVTDLLRPGGRLVYSVCTFPRAETDAACDAILRHRPDLAPVSLEGPDGGGERLRLWPHRHGTDAMFVAAFRRRE